MSATAVITAPQPKHRAASLAALEKIKSQVSSLNDRRVTLEHERKPKEFTLEDVTALKDGAEKAYKAANHELKKKRQEFADKIKDHEEQMEAEIALIRQQYTDRIKAVRESLKSDTVVRQLRGKRDRFNKKFKALLVKAGQMNKQPITEKDLALLDQEL